MINVSSWERFKHSLTWIKYLENICHLKWQDDIELQKANTFKGNQVMASQFLCHKPISEEYFWTVFRPYSASVV